VTVQIAVYSGDAGAVFTLREGEVLRVGRDEKNEIRINDSAVSRAHAIFHGGPPVEVEDLGSANGTNVSHGVRSSLAETAGMRRVTSQARHKLSIGDVVSFGTAIAVVRRAPEQEPTGMTLVDPAMKRVYEQAARAAAGGLSVLILGETGVGKEVLARFIHDRSPRSKKPFLAINCAALSETLLEAELFGHEKGAFTGAVAARPGLIESTEGGTLFLDEVGEMPLSLQAKMLRVLEQREVMRVGARTPKKIDVRFVAATNRDLETESTKGSFRSDLFFRLNGISFTIPPLRERPSELEELTRRFVAAAAKQLDRPSSPTLSPLVEQAFAAYEWPGNIRELRNVIDRAVVLADDEILPDHIPAKVFAAASKPRVARNEEKRVLGDAEEIGRLRREMAHAEKRKIIEALDSCNGNQTKAAELLGISRRTLLHRLDEYGLSRPRKR
jgi:two-component system, NtrC family, response regulator AtoC